VGYAVISGLAGCDLIVRAAMEMIINKFLTVIINDIGLNSLITMPSRCITYSI
jgi:hypothetical protein